MHDDLLPHDEAIVELLATLPRVEAVHDDERDRLIERLRGEGFFRSRRHPIRWVAGVAAAVFVFAAGVWTGANYVQRHSLEGLLGRGDLTATDRVLLLQRAGSAYVRAAQSYADATAHIDSTAVEVASQVLLGAAHAVARSGLDAGVSQGLSRVLTPVINHKPIVWF